jgi:hypothetical protein
LDAATETSEAFCMEIYDDGILARKVVMDKELHEALNDPTKQMTDELAAAREVGLTRTIQMLGDVPDYLGI